MENIVVFGSSGHAKVVIDMIEKSNLYKVCGYIDSFRGRGEKIFDYSVLGNDLELADLIPKYNITGGVIAIGDNFTRYKIYKRVTEIMPQFRFIPVIHPKSCIAKGVEIGIGTVVMPGAIINSDCKIGNFCILNTKSSLDHDSKMENFSSLAPGVTAGGNVHIKEFAAVCLGASIAHGITIADNCVIGAGSVVLKNTESYSVVYGVPGKIIRKREIGDKYM